MPEITIRRPLQPRPVPPPQIPRPPFRARVYWGKGASARIARCDPTPGSDQHAPRRLPRPNPAAPPRKGRGMGLGGAGKPWRELQGATPHRGLTNTRRGASPDQTPPPLPEWEEGRVCTGRGSRGECCKCDPSLGSDRHAPWRLPGRPRRPPLGEGG